ncbi:MAG: cbb3-type cytochrome oxidase assembly protein CcoS [Bacteroidota bacterium]
MKRIRISDVSVLLILIIISLLVAIGFLAAFFWASRSGQFDDDLSPSVRILMDDQPEKNNSTENLNAKN